MKIPISWLQEYIDVNLSIAELADCLTMAGIEVKGRKVISGTWENIIVGQIVAINPHPNADRLRLATVNLGTEQETVVCGAPNLNTGDKIAFARVGARLTDPHWGLGSHICRHRSARIVASVPERVCPTGHSSRRAVCPADSYRTKG